MTYPDSIQFLYDLQVFGARFGLENTLKLAELAGNPHRSLRFIHVAGTNGKGSTCAMLESIYRAAGLRVGLFTSPHLVHFGERIQIDRQPISEAALLQLVEEFKKWVGLFPAEDHPTFFEVVAVMALKYFAEQKCDLVVWETGMGGRLDATNIVTPLASVITNIQFDHQAWLGNTLEKIAREKAGIIKPGVPVITAVEDAGALRVIRETAEKNGSSLRLVNRESMEVPLLGKIQLPLHGAHQKTNAATAVETVLALRGIIPVTDEQIRQGLETVCWAGRLQIVELDGGSKIILDGAHNSGGAETLRDALAKEFAGQPITLILGILQDKDCSEICGLLAPLARRIIVVPVKSKRSATPLELIPLCEAANPSCKVTAANALAEALQQSASDALRVIAGSLYLIGEAMELLGLAAHAGPGEQNLNEWSPAASKH